MGILFKKNRANDIHMYDRTFKRISHDRILHELKFFAYKINPINVITC